MFDKMTQRMAIIAHCRQHGSITIREAVTQLNIGSPTKRISEIRQDPGYIVTQEDVPVYDDDGKRRTHYARYRIEEVGNGEA